MRRPILRTTAEVLLCLFAAVLAAACQSNGGSPEPSPSPGGGESITGRERIGWDQAAASFAELGTFRFAIYVDGNRSEMADVTCASTPGPSGFACSGRLPVMTAGAHVLEIASFTDANGGVESARSAQLRVTVTGASAPAAAAPLADGDRIVTSDGVEFDATLAVQNLSNVADIALASDGRLLLAERTGRIVIVSAGSEPTLTAVNSRDGELLALALAPDFVRSGHLFVVQSQQRVFRLARYRFFEGQLIERMLVIRDVPASQDPAANLRFGPDAKLYAAFDDAGSAIAAARLSEWSGKILRLNPDGTTPDDQAAATPVLWSNIGSPGGLDWPRDGRALWVAETGTDAVERLRALFSGGERPRSVGQLS